jgi:transposase InsO family protein
VKPETVIRWHRTAFRWYWARKSKPHGRPVVSRATIALIKRIRKENPLWSAERIHDQMVSIGMIDIPCANTIAKYIPTIRRLPSEKVQQSWRTFIANHMHNTWAMDFFTVPTITFQVLYVFVIINHARRQVARIAVTKHLTMAWTVHQLRESTQFGKQPKYLIRDNDSIYGKDVVNFIKTAGIQEVRTSYRSPWQNALVERFIGILRRELLDHIVPLDERHLERLLREFIVGYYHPVRTHSSLDHEPPMIDQSVERPQLTLDAELESEPILGGLYHGYRAKAA